MQTISIIGKILVLQVALSVNAINWQPGNWAMQCDFKNRDFANKNNIPSSQCGGLCAKTSGCTHFTWSSYNGGTCWMKNGAVSKSDAVGTSDRTTVCGIIATGPQPQPQPQPSPGTLILIFYFRYLLFAIIFIVIIIF